MMNWGIIGTGMIVDMFCTDFNQVEGAVLHSIYGRRTSRTMEVAYKFNIGKRFSDMDAFLSQPDLDIVYIGTPHTTHCEFAIKAMQAGKHVLCEKPFAVNEEEAKKMHQVAQDKGVFLMEALWTLYQPAIRKAMQWIETGAIGSIKLIEADFGDVLSQEPTSRIQNPDLAGGALLDVGIYPVLLANAVMQSKPSHVKATCHFTKTGVDETTSMTFEYPGAVASLSASVALRTKWCATIYGTKGYIEIPEFFRAKEAVLMSESSEAYFMDRSPGLGYQHEAQAVTDLVREGQMESPIVSKQFTQSLIQTLDAVRNDMGLKYPFEGADT